MLKVKLQYFGHLSNSSEKTRKRPWCWQRLGQEEKGATQDEWRSDGIINSMDMSLSKLGDSEGQGRKPGILQSVGLQRVGHDLVIEQWTTKCFCDLMKTNRVGSGCFSVSQSCLTLCNTIDCSTPGFPVLHYLPVCSHSCPLSGWCHPTTSSSATLFSFRLQSFQRQGPSAQKVLYLHPHFF